MVLIRLYVGLIFACEGVLKFLRPEQLGPGRFDKAGIPAPTLFAYLDGVFEIACGLLILAGLLTRLAVVPMIINMIGALLIAKVPILWGDAPLYSAASGGWDFIRESRASTSRCFAAACSCSSSAPAPTPSTPDAFVVMLHHP